MNSDDLESLDMPRGDLDKPSGDLDMPGGDVDTSGGDVDMPGDLDADLDDVAAVSCPYCGEGSKLFVDPGGGALQEYVEDCEVCCQPWLVRVRFDDEGQASVSVATLDDE